MQQPARLGQKIWTGGDSVLLEFDFLRDGLEGRKAFERRG